MKTIIDQSHWKRKEHFDLFNSYTEPFWGICSEVDCTVAYQTAKDMEQSFYLVYLHKLMLAVNRIKEFRYRVDGPDVILFDEVHASATVGRSDDTFAFSYIKYHPDFDEFSANAKLEISAAKASSGLRMNSNNQALDVIQFSAIPWIKFTSLSHARNLRQPDSIPKFSTGKIYKKGTARFMAISVHAHHGLVDGLHAGRFFDLYQRLLNGDE